MHPWGRTLNFVPALVWVGLAFLLGDLFRSWVILLGMVAVLIAALAWWLIFRGAMKTPNNGNEFSRDSKGCPPG